MFATQRYLLAQLIFAMFACSVAAEDYYVSKKGNDDFSGVKPDQALLTISRGVEMLEPGDTLIVGPGVYHETIQMRKCGTKDKPITLRASHPGLTELTGSVRLTDWKPVKGVGNVYSAKLDKITRLVFEKDTDTQYYEVANLAMTASRSGSFFYDESQKTLYVHPSNSLEMDTHVIDACVLNSGIAVQLPKQRHTPRMVGVVIDGFVVHGYEKYGIVINNADYCTIKNCVVHHCSSGIFTINALRGKITGCEVFSCSDRYIREQGNIGMQGYLFESILENNIVYDTPQYGIRFYGGVYGNVMRNNLAYNCQTGIHVKGHYYDLKEANRRARYSKEKLTPGLTMQFTRNTAINNHGNGLIPKGCVFEYNTGDNVQAGKATKSKANIEFLPEDIPAAKFADPVWLDLRLQADSPFRKKASEGNEDFGAHPYRGDVVYVKPDGDDKADGLCVVRAWKTLAHAVSNLKAGDTLYILPGRYEEAIVLDKLISDPSKPTMIRGYGKGNVLIDGLGKMNSGVKITGCRDLKIQGLKIRGTLNAGIAVDNSSKVEITHNDLFDNRGAGIAINEQCDGIRILSNTIVGNSGAGVKSAHQATGLWVVNNIIRDNGAQLDLSAGGLPSGIFSDCNDIGGGIVAVLAGKKLTSLVDWRAVSGLDVRSVDFKPDFIDVEAGDFRLKIASRCRGRGYLNKAIGSGKLEPPQTESIGFRNVKVVDVGADSADIAWSNTGSKGTTVISYGTSRDKLDHTIIRDTGHFYGYHHSITLRNLKPGTRYFFKVGSRRLLEGGTPCHTFRYLWPRRTPKGEADYYRSLKKKDVFDIACRSFTTKVKNSVAPRVYFVDKNGDEGASGDEAHPFLSIAKACAVAKPGDQVIIRKGIYFETIRPVYNGLPNAPITFKAEAGNIVEINGKNELIPFGADLLDRHHIVVKGCFFMGQSEGGYEKHSGFGQVRMVHASDITIDSCVFDGRTNYVNSLLAYNCDNVTVNNCIFISHHLALVLHDNTGTFTITHNTFLGSTINKIYAVRNQNMIIRNNLFGENLFPKKRFQYKVLVVGNKSVDMDYNCFYFDPRNKENRVVDYGFADIDLSKVSTLPEQRANIKRFAIKGDLTRWRSEHHKGEHSFIADPKWINPDRITALRKRKRGWPNRFYTYKPFNREELALEQGSPCEKKGENSTDVGAQYKY